MLERSYLESELADLDTIQSRLLGSSGGCEFDVVDTEGIESYRQRRFSNGALAKRLGMLNTLGTKRTGVSKVVKTRQRETYILILISVSK